MAILGWHIALDTIIVGCLTGLSYAVLAAGIVLIYRATKVINFAHGEIGAFGAALLAKLVLDWHWNFFAALATVMIAGAVLGAAIDLAVVRRLFKAPRLILLVATIGVSQLVFFLRILLPKVHTSGAYPTPLHRVITIHGFVYQSQHFMILAFAPAVIAGLAVFLSRTPFGVAIRAAADNSDRAELAGIPIKRVSTVVWAIAGGLAVLTVVLLNSLQHAIVGLPSAAVGSGLLLRALAAAMVGGLVSLPRALAGGVAIGIGEAIVSVNTSSGGLTDALLFVLLLLLLLSRRVVTDERGSWSLSPKIKAVPEALRDVWWVGRLNVIAGGSALAIAVALPLALNSSARTFLLTRVLIFAMIGLSVTVLVGWAGQLSLGQFAFVGVGALSATALVGHGMSFPVACGYAAVAGGVAAVIVGFPALRVRGSLLAMTTVAFGVAAQSWLFNQSIFGTGTIFLLPRSRLFGFIDLHSERVYYFTCLAVLVLSVLGVSRLRSSGVGRAMIAVRDNEQAAASFTISPQMAKLSAFIFSGALAGLAGALFAGAMVNYQLNYANAPAPFGPDQSLAAVSMVVIGGLGSIGGAVIGAVYVVGLPSLFGDSQAVGLATSGIGLLVLLLYAPGGLMQMVYRGRDALLARAQRLYAQPTATTAGVHHAQLPGRQRDRETAIDAAPPAALQVEQVSVSFGGTQALRDVSIRAEAGQVVGLIGSNGSGKSTLMNVVSGFLNPDRGRVLVDGQDVTHEPAHARAALGIGRVFQDARLFGDLTLRETVKVALEAHERSEFIPSLLSLPPSRRAERRKTVEADAYIDFLGLGRYGDHFLSDLSTGTRRIVEMCCLLAQGSRLLLLDEPTAGVAQRETEAFGPLIRRIQRELGATVVIIEHDIPLIMSISDHVYCLSAGTKIAEGPPAEVRNDPGVIAAYLGTDERAIARSGVAAKAPQQVASVPDRRKTHAVGNGAALNGVTSLEAYTRAELLTRAAEIGVSGRSRLTKSQLVSAIQSSQS